MLLALLLLLAQKQPLPKDESVLVRVAEKAKLPSLALDGEGNAYIAFIRNGNIEVSVSTDGGQTFSAPIVALDAHGKIIPIPHRGPRIAVDRSKHVYVSAPLCLAPPNEPVINDLYLAVSSDKGKSFGKPVMMNETPKAAGESVHATSAGAGDLHAAWLETREKRGLVLCYAKFDAQGKRMGKAATIQGYCCERCPPAIAVDGLGVPYIAYREGVKDPKTPTQRQIFLAVSKDGGKGFTSTRLNSVDSGLEDCPQDPPAMAAALDGKHIGAAWMDRRDLEHDANVYWAFGAPGQLARDTDVHDDRRFIQRRPSLAFDADNVLWCAWEDGRLSTQRIFFTNSKDARNVPLGDAKDGAGMQPSIAAAGGKVAIAYECGDSIGFRLLQMPK